MKVTLESTTRIIELQTPTGVVPGRVWQGHTESGIKVQAIITRVAVHKEDDASEFERELKECAPPWVESGFPARMVIG